MLVLWVGVQLIDTAITLISSASSYCLRIVESNIASKSVT